MARKVFYDDDARKRVLAGAKILYEAVKTTMGPKGRNVIISKAYGNPSVTHDGVTVAKGVELPEVDDETLGYKVGADLIRQAANKMNDVAGDGTTTVTVLTYHLLNEANKLISVGHNPMLLRKGLEAAAQDVIDVLPALSEKVEGNKVRLSEVATISAGDKQIGELIADVMDKIGKDGVVTVENYAGLNMEADVVEGYTIERGFVSPYMVTDQNRMEAVYDSPHFLITDKILTTSAIVFPFIERIAQKGIKDLVIVAEQVDGELLQSLVLNKLKGIFNSVAIKAPSFGENRKRYMEDIAILTGATIISDESGFTFENADVDMLGAARKVIVTADETTIIEGKGTFNSSVQERIDALTQQIEKANSEYEREVLEKRRAALAGRVAVIKVGGATETEMEEKKYRVDDAVCAVKAALAEGIVPGGGVTLLNIADTIKVEVSDTEHVGKKLLKDALEQPFKILMQNAGLNAEEQLAKVRGAKSGQGVNVNDAEKLVDLLKAGIVDPVRVTKEALRNAVSIAGTAMTMGALVVEIPEKEEANQVIYPGMMQ